VALSIIEDKFSLYWHGAYNDTRIILRASDARLALTDAAQFASTGGAGLTDPKIEREMEKISSLDYTPTVTLTEDAAVVRLIVFSKWGGFSEVKATVSREFPHEILKWKERVKIRYNCMISF